jgi:hypothetical protein
MEDFSGKLISMFSYFMRSLENFDYPLIFVKAENINHFTLYDSTFTLGENVSFKFLQLSNVKNVLNIVRIGKSLF